MRASHTCLECGRPVKTVWLEGSRMRQVLIDPRPSPHGVAWVVRYRDNVPVVRSADHPELVPRNVPIKYTLHESSCSNGRLLPRRHLP